MISIRKVRKANRTSARESVAQAKSGENYQADSVRLGRTHRKDALLAGRLVAWQAAKAIMKVEKLPVIARERESAFRETFV